MGFAQTLGVGRGVTAVIGGGGKTTLLGVLARELSREGTVIVTTTTHIYPPADMPFSETAVSAPLLCVGTPQPNGKLTAPQQSMRELAGCADFVLVEADGAKRLPVKAHAAHEPVVPENASQVICVVGASGLNRPISEAVHRPEIFSARTGERESATPEAVARLLLAEGLHTRVLINQADTPERERAARALARWLDCPTVVAALQKGEILCSF